jgi:hypothetical protein
MGACFSSPAAPSQRNGTIDSKLDLTRPASLAVRTNVECAPARPAVIAARSSPKVGAKLLEEAATASCCDDDLGKCASSSTVALQEMEALVTKVCCVLFVMECHRTGDRAKRLAARGFGGQSIYARPMSMPHTSTPHPHNPHSQ